MKGMIEQLENYDPFGELFTVDEYEYEEEEEDEDFLGEGGRKKWTN